MLRLLLVLNIVAIFVGAYLYFSSMRRIRAAPSPVDTNVGVTVPATFTLERKPSRSFTFAAVLHNRAIRWKPATSAIYSHTGPATTTNGVATVPVTGVTVGQDTLSATVRSSRTSKFYASGPVKIIVHPGYDHAGHPPDEWAYTLDGNADTYVLIGSDRKNFVCFEYTIRKLTWDNTNPTPPLSGDAGCSEVDIVARLESAGYGEQANGNACGCVAGQNKHCAVLYSNQDGDVFHAAAFDPKLCDWGGKLSAAGAIARFKNPGDYIRTLSPDSRATTRMTFYCLQAGQRAPDYIGDGDLCDLGSGR